MSFVSDPEGNITAVAMDENRVETSQNRAAYLADYDGGERIGDVPGDVSASFSKCVASVSPETQMKSDTERGSEVAASAEQPASQLNVDHIGQKTDLNGHVQDPQRTAYVVRDSAETSQSATSGQEYWRPSNPFLGVGSSNSKETGDSIAPKSTSGSTSVPNDRLPLSTSLPSDMLTGYSKPRDSAPSSLCSASPYESPTHATSGIL